MKISMILTSLVVAMSAISLTACEYAGDTEKKASDTMEKSSEVIENTEQMKDEATEALRPIPPPPPE